MLKTFALRDRERAPHGLRAARAARPLRRARAASSAGSPTRLELVELRAGESLERDGYELLVFPASHGAAAVGYALVEDAAAGPVRRRDRRRARRPRRPRARSAAARRVGYARGRHDARARRGARAAAAADARSSTPATRRRARSCGRSPKGRPARARGDVHRGGAWSERGETLHSTARQAAELARDARRAPARAHAHLAPVLRPRDRSARRGRSSRDTVVPRDFDVIEVPFPERGDPTLVKGGAVPERRGDAPARSTRRRPRLGRRGAGTRRAHRAG